MRSYRLQGGRDIEIAAKLPKLPNPHKVSPPLDSPHIGSYQYTLIIRDTVTSLFTKCPIATTHVATSIYVLSTGKKQSDTYLLGLKSKLL